MNIKLLSVLLISVLAVCGISMIAADSDAAASSSEEFALQIPNEDSFVEYSIIPNLIDVAGCVRPDLTITIEFGGRSS